MYSLCADSSSSFEMKIGSIIPLATLSCQKISSTKKSSRFNEYFLSTYTHMSVCLCMKSLCVIHESSVRFYGQLHSLATCLFYSQILINLNPRFFDDESNESWLFDDDFLLRRN